MAERRYKVVFVSAVIVALLATFGVYRVLQQAKASNQVPMLPVVVASQDIPEGGRIDRLALSVVSWPAHAAPAGAFKSADSVVGRVTRLAVFKGEPIVPGRLAPEGTGPGIEVKIAPGKRAMAVKINDVVGLAGLIQPNSRVDVLVTLNEQGGQREKKRAKVFMSNMRVLSVGSEVEREGDGKAMKATTAALEVTPEEAERLAVAMNQGTIQLVLRGYGDPDSIKTNGATSNEVLAQLGGAATERPAPAPRRVASRPRPVERPVQQAYVPPPAPLRPDSLVVQVFRGDKVSQQKFEKREPATVSATPQQ